MKSIKGIVILTIMISVSPCFSSILSRNTFERYEGLDWPLPGWSSQTGNDGVVRLWQESDNEYQTQSHGVRSLHVYDPDNNSYANAYKTFSNSSSEYMTEFYMWIPVDHQSIGSFPLCVLWNIPGEGLPEKTDIDLVIDTLNNPPNGGLFTIHVEDADSIHHNEAIIDSTDRWYKIQIYRHISGSDTVVTLYLDGDSIDTYVPMNKDKVSNTFSLGTTSNNPRANGEIFYDDVIITDCSETGFGSYGETMKLNEKITQIKNTLVQVNENIFNRYFTRDDVYPVRISQSLVGRPYLASHSFAVTDSFISKKMKNEFSNGVLNLMNLANFLNNNFNNLSNCEKLSYFNELIVKLDQIKLGLLYGNLNEVEKGIVMRSLDFIIDTDDNTKYNQANKGGRR